MSESVDLFLRAVHIVGGTGAFILGGPAIVLPKFGAGSRWHRYVGRGYAGAMLAMGLASIPLSLRHNSPVLLITGPLTLLWVAWGWLSLRQSLLARRRGQAARAARLLRRHISLMGTSYLAAWTAFLLTNQPFGTGPGPHWASIIVPAVIGSVWIARTARRLGAQRFMSEPARPTR